MRVRLRETFDAFQQRHAATSFAYAVTKKFSEDGAGQLAAMLAYYGFFSLFPLLLFAVTLLGIVLRNQPELQEAILGSALAQFPIIGDEIRRNIGALARSGTGLLIGLVGALWAGMAGVRAMQSALDRVWNVPEREKPKMPAQLLRGLLMLGVLGAFQIVGTGLAAMGAATDGVPAIGRLLSFAATVAVNVAVFTLAFKVLTVADVSWGDVAPGAVVAAVLWGLLLMVGNYYVGHELKGASQLYGFFGIVLGLLSWMYLGAQVTLLGAEINVVRKRKLWPRSLDESKLRTADRRALTATALATERVEQEKVSVDFER